MPLYMYECMDCQKRFEAVIVKEEDVITKLRCPACQGNKFKKIVSPLSAGSGESSFTPCTPPGST